MTAQQSINKKLTDCIKSDDIGILQMPAKIFHPCRILILKILYLHSDAEFRELKQDLQISDGNLASNLRALEEDGYVEVHKQIIDRKPRTTYVLTRGGLDAFRQFKNYITKVILDEYSS